MLMPYYYKIKLGKYHALKSKRFCQCNILIKSIYYALSESRINYPSMIFGQNISTINHLYTLQKKALKIINLKEPYTCSSPLFHYSKITY